MKEWLGGEWLRGRDLAEIEAFLADEAQSGAEVFPPRPEIFRALNDVPPEAVRVVILGQDPYHGPGQAIGRSFAVPNTLKPKPPSLLNIFKEIESDLGSPLIREQSDLSGWAAQGVLLLNTVLTVRAAAPLSHRSKGWEPITDRILLRLRTLPQPIAFLLWGSEARAKRSLIEPGVGEGSPARLILEAPHPSPLSAHRGFLGCRHFSKTNSFLPEPIDWTRTSLA
jgi:uracil-DNA glycosylase